MDKKTIAIVLACMIALMGFNMLVNKLFPPRDLPVGPTNDLVGAVAGTNAAAQPVVPPPTNAAATATTPAPAVIERAVERPPEQFAVLSNQFVRLEFTSWGGGLHKAEMLQHRAKDGGHVVLDAEAGHPALAIEGLPGTEGAYEFVQQTATSLVMRAQTSTGATITKQLTLQNDYLLGGTISYSQPLTQTARLVIGQMAPLHPGETPDFVAVDWINAAKDDTRGIKPGFITHNLPKLWKYNVDKKYQQPVIAPWGAVKDQFFAMLLTPATNAVAMHYMPHRLAQPADWPAKTPRDAVSASLEVPPINTASGATWPLRFYVGPKEYDRLKALGRGQDELMDFGIFGFLSVILLRSMNFFHKLIPNYGIAIILVTILIKLLFWPIQAKAIRSMKEMQKFQPLMAKLKEKFKDDPQRMNQEMMKLYKEHKINPFSGCLPMLVQIPVFMALYWMLRSAIELRGQSFLWVVDLSRPDTIFHVLGLPINPLPLLMTGSMVWQQKLTPSAGDPQQQKMMMFMPVMMLFFFYSASAGLTLYWTVQQFLSIAQQWWSLRQPNQPRAVPTKAQ